MPTLLADASSPGDEPPSGDSSSPGDPANSDSSDGDNGTANLQVLEEDNADSMEIFADEMRSDDSAAEEEPAEHDDDDEEPEELLSVELEELGSTEIEAVGPPQPPVRPGSKVDEDLLDTLEMPVFRIPSAVGRGAKDKGNQGQEEGGEGRPMPLSNVLQRRRSTTAETAKVKKAPNGVDDVALIPDVVCAQPAGLRMAWSEGLPAEAEAAIAAAEAQKRAGSPAADRPRVEALPPAPEVTASEPEDPNRETLQLEAYQAEELPMSSSPPPQATPAPPEPEDTEPESPAPGRPVVASAVEDIEAVDGLVQELLDETAPAAPKKRGRSEDGKPPWYEEIFTEEYFRTLPMGFHKQTVREAKFISDSLGVGEGGTILDLCCGFGRHTLELAKRGYDMAGLDLSLPLLQKALNEAQRRNLSIKFIHGDVRELNFNEVFDAIFNFQTSFGYFDDRTNFQICKGAHRALKAGGRFLIEVVNRDHIIQRMPLRVWWEGTDCLFLEEVTFDHDRSVLHTKRSFIYDDGRPPWEQNIRIRLYSKHELLRMLEGAGFHIVTVSGSIYTRTYYLGVNSPNVIVLAEKPV